MKRLSIKVSSLLGRVSALGLAILGFAACSEEQHDMHGCPGWPTGTFEIKGAVTAESDGASVAGASIFVKPVDLNYPLNEPVMTDDKGNYVVKETTNLYSKVRVVCTPGADSGLSADSVDVELKYVDPGKDKNSFWDEGHAESTVNFKLKAKAEPDNDTE